MLKVKAWMDVVRLQLNESKTEFIYFGSRQQLKKCTFNKININGKTIQRSDTVKYLGGHLDQHLNSKKHVATKCKAAKINMWKIRMIQKFLTREISNHTFTCDISPWLWQCSTNRCPDVTLSLMQKVQNTTARVVLNKHQSYSATKCLKQLHWLAIKSRIEYKNGMAPKYLQDLLETKETL